MRLTDAMPRRVAAAVAVSALVFGACSGSASTASQAPAPSAPAASPGASAAAPSAAATGKLEIFSYWTAGGEAQGLAALEKVFHGQYPNIKITNAVVAGGAGANAHAVLATRMQGGNPPDSFQIHAGAHVIDSWAKTGYLQPLDSLFKQQGWTGKFRQQLINLVTWNGHIWSVPLDVHRNGVLWYNKKIFSEYNLQPPTTWNQFFQVAATLKSKGITPLALGDKNKWPSLQLFEDILLSNLGPTDYRNIWVGKVPWTDPRVTTSLQTLAKVMQYVNSDHSSLTWDQADGLVQKGTAAMNIMGDWAKGYFEANGWKPNVDFGYVPAPGTQGDFIVVSDSFTLPKNIKDQQSALDWLKVVGSLKGQEAFNPPKGSICARSDCPASIFDAYSQTSQKDFAKDQLVPSEANGPASDPAFLTPIQDAIASFVVSPNVQSTQQTIEQACKTAGVCS